MAGVSSAAYLGYRGFRAWSDWRNRPPPGATKRVYARGPPMRRPKARSTVTTKPRTQRGAASAYANIRSGGLLGLERKYKDGYRNAAAIAFTNNATGGMINPVGQGCLNGISQGDTPSQRDGRRINLTEVEVRCHISDGGTGGDAQPYPSPGLSLYLVRDKQTNGVETTSDDIFSNPSGVSNTNGIGLFRNLEQISRFDILAEWHGVAEVVMQQDAAGTSSARLKPVDIMLKWTGNMTVNYAGTGATVADIVDNSIHIVAFSSSGHYDPNLSYIARCRWFG